MQTRPGANRPINENEIPGLDLPAVTNITLVDMGIEKKALTSTAYAVLSWTNPTGYYPQYYVLQMQKAGDGWNDVQEFISRERRNKITLPVGQDYEVRIAGLTKTSKPGQWSSTFTIDAITSDVTPDPPTITSVIPMVRGLIVNLEDNIEADWDGFKIYVDTTSGFTPASGNLKDKGRKQRFEITDLSPGVRYYIKAIAYDTSGNSSAASNQSDDVAGSETTSSTLTIAANNSSIRGKAGADYICSGASDQVEINNAINILSSIGGKITLLEGTYVIDSSISLKSNVNLLGQGKSTIIKLADNTDTDELKLIVNDDTTNGNDDISISNLVIDGNKANNINTQHGIFISSSSGSSENVIIKNALVKNVSGQGVTLGSNTSNCQVINSNINNVGAYGVVLTSNTQLISCNIQSNNYGVKAVSGSSNVIISDCIIKNNSSVGLTFEDSSDSIIKGNIVESNGTDGILVYNTAVRILVENNIASNNTGEGINIRSSDENNIKNNKCRGNSTYGIFIQNSTADNNLVSNNDCYSNTTAGIRDDGTGTSFGAGNRVNNGSWITGADG